MLTNLIAFLEAHHFQDQPLIIAVSGGKDSVALFHLLTRCCQPNHLIVAHLNHQLRGADADKDAQFVAQISAEQNIPCVLGSADVKQLVSQHGYTIEEAARRARYQFLARVARQFNATAILTAHHADDQAETVLMNLMRGSGLGGLRGMQPVSPVPYGDGEMLSVVRPLLSVRRQQIEAYCQTHKLASRFDQTNNDLAMFRNRVRQAILPALEQDAPQLRKHLRQLSQLANADNALLDTLTMQALQTVVRSRSEQAVQVDRAKWQALSLSLRRRTLLRLLRQVMPETELGFSMLEQARVVAETGQTGTEASLPANWRLRVGYGVLFLESESAVFISNAPQWGGGATRLFVSGKIVLGNGWVISAEIIPFQPTMLTNSDPMRAFIPHQFANELWLRTRQAGERIQPLGLNGKRKKVKQVMINRKLPAADRSRWPIVATSQHALWIAGHLLDERARLPNEKTQSVICICLEATSTV